jgi:hypothetical protein
MSPSPSAVVPSRAPGPAEWLEAWEASARLDVGWREAALLQPACPGFDLRQLAALPLGTRDALLMQLRRCLFGPAMQCSAICPDCGQRCEWEQQADPSGEPVDAAKETRWQQAGWSVRLRPPTGLDLAELKECGADSTGLLARCVLEVEHDGQAVDVTALPPALEANLSDALLAVDPRLDTGVALTCPACGTDWEADFDIGAYLWAELDGWARSLLDEVHRLASAYGWTQSEVLSLGPLRRARYLALVAGG